MNSRRVAPLLPAILLASVAAFGINHRTYGQGFLQQRAKEAVSGAGNVVGGAAETVKKEVGKGTRKATKVVEKSRKEGKKVLNEGVKEGAQLGTTAKATTEKAVKSVKKNAGPKTVEKVLRKTNAAGGKAIGTIKSSASAGPKLTGQVLNPSITRGAAGPATGAIEGTKRLSGDMRREGNRAGGDLSRQTKRVAGDGVREGKQFLGEVTEEGKRTAGDGVRETKRLAEDAVREGKHATGDVVREVKGAGGDLARESQRTGGNIAREGKRTMHDIVREGKHATGDVSRESKTAVDDIRQWPGEIGKKKSDPFAIGTLLGGSRRERRPIVVSNEERREILRQEGYDEDQRGIIEQIVFSDGGLKGKYAQAFDEAFNSAFEQDLERWWVEKGSQGAELTDAEVNRLADRAYAKAETAFLERYGFNIDGNTKEQLQLALRAKDEDGNDVVTVAVPGHDEISYWDPQTGNYSDADGKVLGNADLSDRVRPSSPTKSAEADGDHSPVTTSTGGSDNTKVINDRIKTEFKDRLRDKLAERVNKFKNEYGDVARDALKELADFRDKALTTIKEKGQEKVVDGLEKLIGAGSVSGAQTATAIVRDMLGEYQDRTSEPTLQRDEGSKLVLPHEDWSPLNPAGWSSTRHAAFEKAANEGKTVYQDANGNWYQNDNPKFVPGGPFTVLYQPVPRQPDGGTVKEVQGTATEKDRIQVSDAEIGQKVGAEYLGDWFKDKVKEKLGETLKNDRTAP